ncbi:MAG: T9SS type A sorting domain-containing protein [Flavobacteriales bacterium]|nr:T9SS type A sorting domain-containing protein [Flavobacteriales bacterium]
MSISARSIRTFCLTAVSSLAFEHASYGQGNDNCALAVPQSLSVGSSITLSGNNSAAGATGDFVTGSIYAGSPVYWVKFTTTQCANVSISFCGQSPAWIGPFDVLASTCPADVIVHASLSNTSDCGDGNVTFFYNLLPAGTWSFAVLNNPGAGMSGPFNLTVSATACAQNNDLCSDVTPQLLSSGSSLNFSADNTGATSLNDFDASSPYFGSPVFWHAITLDACNTVTLNYCGQNPVWSNVFGVLFTACPGLQPLQATGFNTTDCGDGNATFFFDEIDAGTYYIPVLADGGSGSIGPYTITVSALACTENNDLCSDVTPQPLASGATLTFSADNSTATSLNDFDASSPYFGSPVFWHAFTTDGCNTVTVSYCGQNPAWSNTFGILARDCPGLDLVSASQFNTTDCGDGNTTFIYNTLAAGTYYLPVLSAPGQGSSGPYTIQVSAVACPIDFNLCTSPPDLALAAGASLTFSANNTNAGATDDWAPGNLYFGTPVNWHRLTTTACTDVRIAYCGTTPVWANTLGLLANSCPADQLTFFSSTNQTDCIDGNATWLYNDLPAGTWYVPVLNDPGQSSSGPYTITASAIECNIGFDEMDMLDWSVFPNPSEGGFNLMYGGSTGNATIEIIDLTGRVVFSERAQLTAGSVHLVNASSELAAGGYELRLTVANSRTGRRVMVR